MTARLRSRERLGGPLPLHAVLEDVEFLARHGCPPEQVAARLGMRLDSLASLLRRHGHHLDDILHAAYAAARHERKGAAA